MNLQLPLRPKVETKVLSIRSTTSMIHNIDKIAADNKSTRSEVVRYAVDNLIDKLLNA